MVTKGPVAKSATEGLKTLWEDKYFRSWKKMDAIVGEFAKRDNHFSDAELGMALKRAKYLVCRGKRRSYEYIQKYPFVPKGDGEAPAPKKGRKS
jgi:hypothetical protein